MLRFTLFFIGFMLMPIYIYPEQDGYKKQYFTYWLTRFDSNEYVDLLIAKQPVESFSRFKFDTQESLFDAEAIIVTTYAKDSIWNTDFKPFKQVVSIKKVDASKQLVVLNQKKYQYSIASLREVINLLENPEGTIAIHRILSPTAGAEDFIPQLLLKLKQADED